MGSHFERKFRITDKTFVRCGQVMGGKTAEKAFTVQYNPGCKVSHCFRETVFRINLIGIENKSMTRINLIRKSKFGPVKVFLKERGLNTGFQ
ncbi:hypothetical protein SDC9_199845 [bioreactor metagenome]|uniref:Uncharacterized protein n=1 Tax=bioreactor metagenome TaxID=1076179 RepID=A0A645IP60_9ZZZZ